MGWLRGFSLVQIARATEPMLSRDSNWVLQLKISRTWRPWAVWSVGFCGVRFAIYIPRRARGTAKPECFDMFRVADRPATHARSKLHKFNSDRRGERPRFIATLPIGHELRGSLWSPQNRPSDVGRLVGLPILAIFCFRNRFIGVVSALASDQLTACYLLSPTDIIFEP